MKKVNSIEGKWSRNDQGRNVAEQKLVYRSIQRWYDQHNNMNLSLIVNNQNQSKKLGSTVYQLIGTKYLNQMLEHKYQVEKDKIYLKECRRVVELSKKFYTKTTNGLMHVEKYLYREEKKSQIVR